MTLYEAQCEDKHCKWHASSMFEAQVQRLSEDHMMETGHIVEVIEWAKEY